MLKVLISRPSIICNDDQQIINLDKYLNLRFPKCCKIEVCNIDVSLYDYKSWIDMLIITIVNITKWHCTY